METFIAAALIGVVVGICSGLLGIGGGTLMVPIFRLGFGLSAFVSTATSLFTIIPTSLVGFVTHIKNKTCIPKIGITAGLAGACTSPLGVYLNSNSPAWAVMLAAAIIIGYSAFNMFKKAMRIPKVQAAEGGKALGVDVEKAAEAAAALQAEEPEFKFTKKSFAQALCIGLIAGLASGYVGVGGGFIMVPLFISVLGVMMRLASGTSLVAIMILAIPGVIEQALLGNINYTAGIAMAVGSIPGAVIGANLIRKIPERQLRFIFGTFLVISAVVLLVNEFMAM
jgi:uncharacterized protein